MLSGGQKGGVRIGRALELGQHLAMLVRADESRTVTWANASMRAALGIQSGPLGTLGELMGLADGDAVASAAEAVELGLPLALLGASGVDVMVSHDVVPVDDDGTCTHWLLLGRDVTCEHEAREVAHVELVEAHGLLQRIVDVVDDHVYTLQLFDGELQTIACGPGCERLLGAPIAPDADLDALWDECVHPDDRGLREEAREQMRRGEELIDVEYRLIGLDGVVRWVWERARGSVAADGSVVFDGTVTDVSARKSAEERIAHMAFHDDLTALPNRSRFREALHDALDRARANGTTLAVLFVDLDEFKLVNDSLGHSAGDELLRLLAQRLRAVTGGGELIARHGGDEFLALLELSSERDPISSAAAAEAGANRVHDALDAPFKLAGMEVYGSASIGVSLFPFDADDAETLLQHADAAMYRAKRAGRGRTRFFAAADGGALARLSLETALRRAIEREEFVLHWQPIVALPDGTISGAEALVRWNDPRHGLRPPGDFIELAEQTGMIEPIGEWVMYEALRQGRTWHDQGIDLTIAFNVSMRQLRQPGFAHGVISSIADCGLPPSSVFVEITESAAAAEAETTPEVLHELAASGVNLALDDFGTGYSSLNRLAELPVKLLKIDRSFMRRLPGDSGAERVVALLLQLAQGLGVAALAEGIESASQLDLLERHGCAFAQGYYFSRPLPADAIASLLIAWPLAA